MLFMALTPNDILNKEFNNKFRGYDANEVNDYLDIIVSDYESMISEINQLKQELSSAKEKNEYFAQLQDSLNSSIVVAQEAADRLKQNARKEAELILFEAEREADRLINNASDTAKNIVTESDALRRSSKTYRAKLEQMIRQQLEIVSSDEYHELFDEELDTQFEPEHFKEASKRVNDRVDRLEEQNAEGFDAAHHISNDQYFEETEVTRAVPVPEYTRQHDVESDRLDSLNDDTMAFNLDQKIEPSASSTYLEEDSDKEYSDPKENIEPEEPVSQEDRESVLGQTIRIDLPKE